MGMLMGKTWDKETVTQASDVGPTSKKSDKDDPAKKPRKKADIPQPEPEGPEKPEEVSEE